MPPVVSMKRTQGFGLIELLVVVVLMAALAGLYFGWYAPRHSAGAASAVTSTGGAAGTTAAPGGTATTVLGKAYQKGESVECMNNLHQLRLAIQMYVDDNGSYPPNLAALNLPNMTHCPVTGVAYKYDPSTGKVMCPSHPNY